MKTFKIIPTALFLLAVSTANAQIGSAFIIKGIEVQMENTGSSFRKLSNDIAFNTDFNYRKELKKSRSEHTVFHFRDTTLTKTKVLKHLRKAARSSDNSIQFQAYFLERQLDFINELDSKTLAGMYDVLRSKTLNGYLDILAVFALSDRMVHLQEGS